MSANSSQPRSHLRLLVLAMRENGWMMAAESDVERSLKSFGTAGCLLQALYPSPNSICLLLRDAPCSKLFSLELV